MSRARISLSKKGKVIFFHRKAQQLEGQQRGKCIFPIKKDYNYSQPRKRTGFHTSLISSPCLHYLLSSTQRMTHHNNSTCNNNSRSNSTNLVGLMICDYRIEKLLGEGNYAKVFLAQDTRTASEKVRACECCD